jgi:hypothetical protein
MAVCLYHAPDHLWTIPLRLSELLPNSRFTLRTYCGDGVGLRLLLHSELAPPASAEVLILQELLFPNSTLIRAAVLRSCLPGTPREEGTGTSLPKAWKRMSRPASDRTEDVALATRPEAR